MAAPTRAAWKQRAAAVRLASRALGSKAGLAADVSPNRMDKHSGGVSSKPSLTLDSMNERLKNMQYAVRGEVPLAAARMQREMAKGASMPFDKILYCNIGNPQSVGQPHLTFYRSVMALVDNPRMLSPEHRNALHSMFDDEEIARAEEIVRFLGEGGSGAYTDSQGVAQIREHVARFIEARDGYASDPDCIFLTSGASSGISMLLTAVIARPDDAVMIPIPQYPIYTALINLLGGQQAGYFLNEDEAWSLREEELERSFEDSVRAGNRPRAIVVINPGNPTGSVLSYDDLATVVRFCHRHSLVLLSDEVYQDNCYNPSERPFVSCKKVVGDLGLPVELASFHSTSKGFIGECGRRGGYMELCNFDPDVQAQIVKLASSNLCSNTNGQILTDLMVRPPAGGTAAQARFEGERDAILGQLAEKASMVHAALNEIPGVSCQRLEGAMYAFPRLELPQSFVEKARRAGKKPDALYALSLLEKTGICTVPGSGFEQEAGTHHLRLTFLPRRDDLAKALDSFAKHHREIC